MISLSLELHYKTGNKYLQNTSLGPAGNFATVHCIEVFEIEICWKYYILLCGFNASCILEKLKAIPMGGQGNQFKGGEGVWCCSSYQRFWLKTAKSNAGDH